VAHCALAFERATTSAVPSGDTQNAVKGETDLAPLTNVHESEEEK